VMSVSRNADSDTYRPLRRYGVSAGTTCGAIRLSSAATVQECEPDDGDSKKRRMPSPMSSKKVLKQKEKENISSDTSMGSSESRYGLKRPRDYFMQKVGLLC
jgi:hypothetical protein